MRREPFYGHFGARVRQQRQYAGLTQEQLGAALSPPQTRASVANIEAGLQRVNLLTSVQLATIFRCPLAALVPPDEPKKGRKR